MTARSSSADRLLTGALLLGGVGCGGILVSVVALPLAFSSPFPSLRDGSDWIIDHPPIKARLAVAELPLPVDLLQPEPQTDGRLVMATLEGPGDQPLTFAERWNLRVPQVTITIPAEPDDPDEQPDEAPDQKPDQNQTSRPPAAPDAAAGSKAGTAQPAKAPAPAGKRSAAVDMVEQYLWEVYQRKPVKSDSTGDFTWKDQAAAKRLGMSVRAYVISGMDPDFREQLYHAGHAMDASGLNWSMLSAFRDDYRQGLAAGFKAHGGNSLHGGSRATGGYGHGRAVDITGAEGEGASEAIWHWVDAHGAKYGLLRPMTRIDPAHIQARGSYRDLAHALREARLKLENKLNGATAAASGKTKVASSHVDK
jgi:hypothetical protein